MARVAQSTKKCCTQTDSSWDSILHTGAILQIPQAVILPRQSLIPVYHHMISVASIGRGPRHNILIAVLITVFRAGIGVPGQEDHVASPDFSHLGIGEGNTSPDLARGHNATAHIGVVAGVPHLMVPSGREEVASDWSQMLLLALVSVTVSG